TRAFSRSSRAPPKSRPTSLRGGYWRADQPNEKPTASRPLQWRKRMRFVKSAIVALTALAAMGGSAYALDVNKKIAAPAQVLTISSTISDFCSIKDWHPTIADCKESTEGSDTFRVLTLKDNGGSIKEKLTGTDDTSYSYEIVESPLPVKNYSAKLWVEP